MLELSKLAKQMPLKGLGIVVSYFPILDYTYSQIIKKEFPSFFSYRSFSLYIYL